MVFLPSFRILFGPYHSQNPVMVNINSDNPIIREAALELLCERSGDQSKSTLIKALDDPEVMVRSRATELLAYLGDASGLPRMQKDFEEWKQRYEKGIGDGDRAPSKRVIWRPNTTPVEVLRLSQILARFGDNRGFELAARVLIESSSTYWRETAINVLCEIKRNDRSTLLAENRDPDPIFIVIAETDSNENVLNKLVTKASTMDDREIRSKILDTVIASEKAPEKTKAIARQYRDDISRREQLRNQYQEERSKVLDKSKNLDNREL